jgi:hypothetical protein
VVEEEDARGERREWRCRRVEYKLRFGGK